MIKAILFDIDNTLMDFMKMKTRCCNEAIDAMIGAGWKVKKKKALNSLYELYDKYGMEYDKVFQKLLKKESGKIDYRLLAHGITTYRNFCESYLVPYSKVIPTLLNLNKKYRLAVVSDAPRIYAWMRLVTMNLDGFFEFVVTKGDVKREKTSVTPFNVVLNKLQIKPNEALMIGDRINRDIQVPKKMGIKTCYARYGDKDPLPYGKSGADFEIGNISELIKILKILE